MPALDPTTTPGVVADLQAIFAALPDAELLAFLRGPKRRGRPGHDLRVLWRCHVARYALGVESVSALLCLLHSNPYIAQACGISTLREMPSQPTMSRFGSKLARRWNLVELRNVQRRMTTKLYETLPDFGKSVAIDSTTLKGWSNPMKKGKQRSAVKRQRAKVGRVSDQDCGWSVKKNTRGNVQYTFGFKAHILCDTTYELPLVLTTSPGNRHDVKEASPLLRQARVVTTNFLPDYVLCDAGYSSDALRHLIRRQYRAQPVIAPNAAHKRAVKKWPQEWNEIYKRRTSIERVNGRLKGFFALDNIRVRGKAKVSAHAHLAVIALQARALAFPQRLRNCVA